MTDGATPPAPPATLVILGVLGDLSRRLLMPSVARLARDGLVGDGFRVLGVGRDEGDAAMLRGRLDEALKDEPAWDGLRERVDYLAGDLTDPATFAALAGRVEGNAAFYLAVAPSLFAPVVDALAAAGLLDEGQGFRRIAIEKPFGHDLASARDLNAAILAHVPETQVYRIDHFLGKETVQNILVARFANVLTEAGWDAGRIDHVQITAAETVAVGTRGSFYDATGALRDMVPNHLFQLLAMIAMERPDSLDPEAVRDAKAAVMKAVRPADPLHAARGRYAAGRVGGADVPDYRAEADVAADSRTETYAALRLEIDRPRWAGVPFYLRTGKALCARDTEIVVQLRDAARPLFADVPGERPPNRLVIQVQPQEGIDLHILAKKPGAAMETAPIDLAFRYADRFDLSGRTGYETLIYDLLVGDQTLFQRADMIEAGWAAVQPLLDAWGQAGEPQDYAAGSVGPASADALIAADGRHWHAIG